MTTTLYPPEPCLKLQACSAADLMTPNPISIRQGATVGEAVALLTDRGFSGAPVVDESGRPVGVVTQTDVLIRDREKADHLRRVPEYYTRSDALLPGGEPLPAGFHVEAGDRTAVAEIMTPGVFAVTPETPVTRVIEQMLGLRVHRLFVVGHSGALIGVISLFDILRRLQA